MRGALKIGAALLVAGAGALGSWFALSGPSKPESPPPAETSVPSGIPGLGAPIQEPPQGNPAKAPPSALQGTPIVQSPSIPAAPPAAKSALPPPSNLPPRFQIPAETGAKIPPPKVDAKPFVAGEFYCSPGAVSNPAYAKAPVLGAPTSGKPVSKAESYFVAGPSVLPGKWALFSCQNGLMQGPAKLFVDLTNKASYQPVLFAPIVPLPDPAVFAKHKTALFEAVYEKGAVKGDVAILFEDGTKVSAKPAK